jgi:hypothetical protein
MVQQAPLFRIQCLPCPVDVKRQHRHRRSIRTALSSGAGFGGTFQRKRDLPWAALLEYALFEVQSIAVTGHFPGPPSPAGRLLFGRLFSRGTHKMIIPPHRTIFCTDLCLQDMGLPTEVAARDTDRGVVAHQPIPKGIAHQIRDP